ncbi:hypothetical protein E8F11_11260 [Pseudomonas sp. BN417]|uniref:hypothetical protein n=1 Tax=Pseudomonas sp. BN417 TaxID=2567890 RepID=UPI00245757BC|nr:hypothetical protein [Pseudomonas sp. BN417]MDH4555743.1 hypothetical protein [Pseudomonas sp. BN417]
MLPLTSFFCDVLPARPRDPDYYKAFLTQYTLITVPAIFSQGILTPGSGKVGEKAELDSDVDAFVNELPDNAQARRQLFGKLCFASQLDPGEMIQESEKRTFVSQSFIDRSKEVGISNRELILSALNASAFLNYFCLFEDTIKQIYHRRFGYPKDGTMVAGGEIVSVCLKKILDGNNITESFSKELARRSKFFVSFETLSATWDLMNLIRNRLIHHGGYYGKASKITFKKRLDAIVEELKGDECPVTASLFLDSLEPIEKELTKTGRLTFCNALENCIRNLSLFVVESLLLSERASRRNKHGKPHANERKPERETV